MAQVSQTADASYGDAGLGDRPVNTRQIFIASFVTLIAAGIGFAVRGGILADWGAQFGFTQSDLGVINGAGLAGFGITIIFFSFFADSVGYRALLILAFLLLLISAVVTLCAGPVFHAKGGGEAGQKAAYWTLYIGTFIFSIAQGLCEAAINPLTATLYPRQKTHYLNILHAGWPGGLVIGSLLCYLFATKNAAVTHVRWEVLSSLYLVPTLYFGLIVLKNRFPISEAKAAGVSVGQMIVTVITPVLLFLFLLHAMVGYVELGTDSWIQNIMNNTIGKNASLLLAYTSILMFILRFFAGPIVHKINPLGLLFVAACCGATGLYLLGTVTTGVMIAVAATVFALGKTFYWPTMLGVIGERFPRGGAVAMGLSGGIGMLSAGFLGGPGIGYTQDRYASTQLQQTAPAAYQNVKADQTNHFLFFDPVQGLDGQKVAVVTDRDPATGNPAPAQTLQDDLKKKPDDPALQKLNQWYTSTEQATVLQDREPVGAAVIYGGRKALQVTSLIPVAMAAGYLLLVFYFIAKGGYKAVHLDASGREVEVSHEATPDEAMTGGVPGPVR